MKFVILFLLIWFNGSYDIQINNRCECAQLYEIDCYRNQKCIWNKLQLKCEIKQEIIEENTTNTQQIKSYCTKFTSDQCWNIEGCAYILNECVQFTACSSYPFSVQELCQMVSKKCITDGDKCVQIDQCNTYLTSVSCIKNLNEKYCFWDNDKCIDVNDCDKLPQWFKSDLECRNEINYCTINIKGGCQLSGYNCQDQLYEMQCYYDQQMNPCQWFNGQCINRSCETAPLTIKTDQQCQEYLQGCTLIENGGCKQRTQCNDVKIKEGCTYNIKGEECFWNNNICYDKKCENAPKDIIDCKSFLQNCVPKLKGGCMSINECNKYELEQSCIIDIQNNKCYWTGKECVIHECINAPQYYITHEQCTQFKQDCTVNQQTFQGCEQRTCNNAPTTSTTFLQTNYECNEYLNGCITKLGGGCKLLKECNDIDIDIACIVDNQNRRCFYYNGQCKLLTCENAPLEYNTHQQCQQFNQECTVTRTLQGCVKMSCQILISQETCKIDSQNNRCYWTGLCYQKTCLNAPFDYNTHQLCNNYLNTCTIANSGNGCILIPSSCSMMVLQDQCKITSLNQICGWFEGACYNKACFTAPNNSDYDTYEECNTYLNGCTVASEGNGGCIPLDQCTTYTAQRSCRYNNLNLLCEWTGSACYDKSCTTASSDKISNTDCNTYLNGCIVSPTGNGCIAKPNSCLLISTNLQCTNLITNSGPCVWTTSCIDRTCSNAPQTIDYDTHLECYTFLPTCTVLQTGIGGCMTQYTYCHQYGTFRSCQLTNNNQQCSWQYNYCYNRQCSYAPDTNEFDTDQECSSYLSSCTVIRRIDTKGCTTRYSNCQDLTQQQCIKDSNGNLCTWNTTLATPYCVQRTCSLMIGYTYTESNCNNWMSSCHVDSNATHTSCISIQYYCSWYYHQDNCIISSTNQCYWNGSSCVNRSCTTVQDINDYNHTNCNTWMSSCTVGYPTSCIIKPTNCNDYVNYDQCNKNITNFPCTWVNDACTEKTCTNHGYYVTTFNQNNCNNWLSLCSVNSNNTACEPTHSCSNYTGSTFTHNDCQTWLNTCTTDGTQCIIKTCTNYGSNITIFNNSNCNAWFNECTNDGSSACKSNHTCTNYGSKITIFNYTNCNNWLSTCTNTNTGCETKTCYNYGNNILYFSHTTCNNWLSTCTISYNGLSCENKTCYNYGQQITTFDTTSCQTWLSECQVNSNFTACETSKQCTSGVYTSDANCQSYQNQCTYVSGTKCTNRICTSTSGISIYNHRNCTLYYPLCTVNSQNTGCQWRTCYNANLSYYSHKSCEDWLLQCTVNSTSTNCTIKTCINYGTHVTTFTDAECNKWHPSCNSQTSTTCIESRVCSSAPTGYQYTHTNCEAYSLSCTNLNTTTCTAKTCNNATNGLTTFTHSLCQEWLNTCTVNLQSNACETKTCTNYKDQLTTINHTTCSTWDSTCTSNITGTACELKTCYNHEAQVPIVDNTNCNIWKSGCVAGTTTCRETNTLCSSYTGTYNHTNCTNYLNTCTNSGSTKCITRTCALASQGGLSIYNHTNCTQWYKECTSNSTATGCIDRTCTNYGDMITVFNTTNCSNWLNGCDKNSTNDACMSIRSCSNYGTYILEFTHETCSHWLNTCTVNGGNTGCIDRTCSNYGTNVTVFNYTNCNNWLYGCTGNGTICEIHSCSNASSYLTVYSQQNCKNWYSYCQANSAMTACESTRTCTNHDINVTIFDHTHCNGWVSSCTVNSSNTACETKTCTNTNIGTGNFNLTTCSTWLPECISNLTADNCETVKTCANAIKNLTSFTHATCSSWKSTCTKNDASTACMEYTCANADMTTFNHTNCKNYLSTCTVNSGATGCVDVACDQAINQNTSFNHSSCQSFKSSCTVNSTNNGCVEYTCANAASSSVSYFSHENCYNYKPECTNNSSWNNCEDRSCSNAVRYYNTNGYYSSFQHSYCSGWLSSCTINSSATGCETMTCENASYTQPINYLYDCTNSWMSTCELNTSNNACITKTCTTYRGTLTAENCASYFASCTYYGNYDNTSTCTTTVRTCASSIGQNVQYQSGCDNWKSGCAYKGVSAVYGCEERTCSNYVTANLTNPTSHSQCYNWLSNCTYNSSTQTCVEKACSNFSQSAVNHTNCQAWNSQCTANIDLSGCERKDCQNYSRVFSLFRDDFCNAWWFNCKANTTYTACETDCTSTTITTFNFTNCQNWDPYCSINSGSTNCEKRNCSNAHLSPYNNSNCYNWLNTCTNLNTTSCQDRTCYNYYTNILLFTNNTCNTWLSSCTNYSTLGCMTKMCENYTGVVSDTNCSQYLSYCVADTTLTKCITFRTCANAQIASYTHTNCENWLSTCTNNSGSTACIEKTCSNIKLSLVLQLNSYTCSSWKLTCTYSNNSCIEKTCSNSNLSGTDVTQTNCSNWLSYCRANNTMWPQFCDLKTCQNHSITIFNHTNCQNWLSYCTVNSAGNACITYRTCPNANLVTFNHINCERWLSDCTVNSTNNGCINKTCYNTNLSTFNDQTCGQWQNNCKVNSTYNGCEIRTCTNYGNQITTFNSTTCKYWHYQCINDSSTSCKSNNRTCSNYGNLIQTFDMITCSQYLSTCVPDQTNSICIQRTCNNARELLSYNLLNCTNWLNTCTVNISNDACIDRTCSNASLSKYNHTSCQGWLNICTVNSTNDGCTIKTCSNSVVTSYTQINCTNWLNTCTNGTNTCIDKTCLNFVGTVNNVNCNQWLSYCYADTTTQTQCQSLRNCYNHNLSTFTVNTCNNWSPLCTVNSTNDGCIEKTCYNTNLTKFSHINCSGWLSQCTVNTLSTGCEIHSCINHGNNITQFNNTNCASWWKYCKVTTLNNACEPILCTNASLGTYNHTNCYNFMDQCTVADNTSCGSTRTCSNAQLSVYNHANCQYWLSKCTVNTLQTGCEDMSCSNAQIIKYTHNNCQNWMFSCTVNLDGTNCETKSCSNYGANVVIYTHANCLAWLSTCTSNSTNSACIDKTCINTTGISSWTQNNCEAWLSVCQLNKPSTCQNNISNCPSATYNQCVQDTNNDICVWYQNSCQDRSCTNFTGTVSHTNCENWLKKCTINTTDNACVQKPTYCYNGGVTNNQCVISYYDVPCAWVSGSCVNRLCTHYTGTFNHTNCQTWLNTCTVNSTATACQTKVASCTTYTTSDQCKITSGGTICFWDGILCLNRTCEHADQTSDYDTDDECKAFLSTCTVARVGGCTDKLSTCAQYKQSSQCYQNSTGTKCFWNTLTSLCGDAICSNALTTLSSHTDCQDFLTTCTAKNGGGCIPLAGCTTYTYQISCIISNTGDTCEWLSGNCYIKACTTAANTRINHEDCQNYMPNCTVAASGTGCVALNNCNTYTAERQCIINASSELCGWNGLVCANRACTTAPSNVNYSNDNACENYMDGCTVVESGYGCTQRLSQCSDYQVQQQCVKTLSGQQCYWNSELPIPICEIRTCFNAPSTSLTPQLCEQHLNTCYSNMQYCRLEQCEDLLFKTDFECKYYNSKCTTDGTKCIIRKKCEDMQNQAGCVISDDFIECEWYNDKCVIKTCFTAPAYTTEQECNYYKNGCTTKIFGGCRPKTTCSDATIEAACTTSITGELCKWEYGYCRLIKCEDFDGSFDEMCDAQKSGCVSDGTNCILPRYCSQISIKDQCIKGIDGPCVWYEYGCSLFLSCNSIQSNLDSVCKSANKLCTTDGLRCMGLDFCKNYKFKEQCNTGLDGNCQWYDQQQKCLIFKKCTDLPFVTHQECNQISNKCTTDTLNGCIELQSCFKYKQKEQCKISSESQKIENNQIIKTGYCAWNNGKCRDQTCEDLTGEVHESCASKLKDCTSNGSTCINIQNCTKYSDLMTCNIAIGSDGKCIYSSTGCRPLECTDIKNGTNHYLCQNYNRTCISNGIECISQVKCEYYPNQYACTYIGIDGQCVWNGEKCGLMNSCQDAYLDMIACQRMSELCNWQTYTNGTSSCSPHTCQTKGINNQCNYVKSFDGKTIQTCILLNEQCVSIDPTLLQNNDCFSNTLYTYHWNPESNLCESCTKQINNTNITTVSYQMILSIIVLLLII